AARGRYAIDVLQGHGAIRDAINELAPMTRHDPTDPLHQYAAQTEPAHLWALGDYSGILSSLYARGSVIPAEELQRWRSQEERFATEVGAVDPDTLTVRANIGYWTGQAGDARQALRLYRELLPDQERVQGPDHPHTLAVRGNVAAWTGEVGDAREALRLYK